MRTSSTSSGIAIGQSVGPYRIEGLLGSGGMGWVYLARDTRLRRTVAIKVVNPQRQNPDALLREARLAAALDHPAICAVYEVGHVGDEPFIVMEHVKGAPLSTVIKSRGGVPAAQAVTYARQVADAVAHAHDRGIIHGDIKSSNIMVAPDGRVKVLDFGLAARSVLASTLASPDADTTCPSPSSGCAGTVPYMAPELLLGRAPTVQSEIWAQGVVLHEMLSGGRPFRGATPFELGARILANQRGSLPVDTPDHLRRVIDRCLDVEPTGRYPSVRDLGSALAGAAFEVAEPWKSAPVGPSNPTVHVSDRSFR